MPLIFVNWALVFLSCGPFKLGLTEIHVLPVVQAADVGQAMGKKAHKMLHGSLAVEYGLAQKLRHVQGKLCRALPVWKGEDIGRPWHTHGRTVETCHLPVRHKGQNYPLGNLRQKSLFVQGPSLVAHGRKQWFKAASCQGKQRAGQCLVADNLDLCVRHDKYGRSLACTEWAPSSIHFYFPCLPRKPRSFPAGFSLSPASSSGFGKVRGCGPFKGIPFPLAAW